MIENKLKQKDLALLLETNTSRISEYLNGKRDITIEIPVHCTKTSILTVI
jgi:HTH-type transcriptional regulator/antitoxin HigA